MKRTYRARRPRTTYKRRYVRRTTGSVIARRTQRQSLTYVRKKYTKTFIFKIAQGASETAMTISHIGTKNSNGTANSITLTDTEQDDNLGTDMDLYQFARITGVAIKMFFPEGTTTSQTPVQWSMAYSASDVIYP